MDNKKIEVRYYTRSGNTKKLADAIALELGVEAKDVSEPLKSDVDILFLGSSVYAAGVDEKIKKFISNIDVKVGTVVNFSTAAIINSTYNQVKKLLDDKNINMSDKEFHCRGSFGIIHKDRPNEKDIEDIKKFVRNILDKK